MARSDTILSTIARRRASQLYRGLRLNLKSSSFFKAFRWAWVITVFLWGLLMGVT